MNALACSAMAMIVNGGCLIQLDRFHPKTWWDSVRESGATALHYLGVMPAMLMGAQPIPQDRHHSVRYGLGSAVDIRQHAAFEERFGFPLLEGWAMTETGSGGLIIAHDEPRKIGTATIGRPSPEIEVKLVDDDGNEVGPGVPGEVLIRRAGPDPRFGFFSEYLKDPEATKAAWEGGFFHTGDLMRSDEEGFLYFVDRKKNVIRRSGENISAVEVETVIRRHPKVREAACAPTPDPVRQDEVLACILLAEPVAAPELPKLAEEIVRLCLDQLAYFKAPGYVAFVDALPLTATQKVQRAELKVLAQSLPGTARCFDTRAMKKRS
jgi:acyl-coenzyme A synthetase/AMP-(fatty) acid ligase